MNVIISKINIKNIWKILFFIILLINIICMKHSGDDLYFVHMWDPQSTTFLETAIERYMTWSPRVISEWLTYFFCNYFFLFKIINSIICTVYIYILYKIVIKFEKKDSLNTCLICLFFMILYPWTNMKTAGMVTTFIFYLWPFTALLYTIYIMIKYNDKIKITNKEYILYIMSLIFASNIEQTVVYIIVFSLIFIGYSIKNRKENTLNIVTLIISILGLIFLLTAPGEANRFILEIGNWYPAYEMLSFTDRLNLGLTSTMFHFIKIPEAIIFYLFFLIGLFIIVWNKYNNKYYLLMVFNFIWIIIGVKIKNNDSIIIGMENFKMLDAMNVTTFGGYLPTLISMLLLLWPCIGLYLIYNEDSKKCFMIIFIYLFSFCDRFIMGFSPTIFASSTRTYLPVFIMFIFINSLIYINIFQCSKNERKH